MAKNITRNTPKISIIGTGLTVALLASLASANNAVTVVAQPPSPAATTMTTNQHSNYKGFNNPTKGIEIGLEQQIETIEPNDEKVVQRTFARVQRTYDWQVYKDLNLNTFDVEVKAGLIGGQYKGSKTISEGYGSFKEFRGGVNAEVSGIYTLNTAKVDPFAGVLASYEFMSRPRSEYQADAVAGIKFNVDDSTDLSLRYRHVLIHGMDYHSSNMNLRQDDGHAIALIGTKRMSNNTSHTLKLEYENFDIGEVKSYGYEPDTDNWLLSYKKTF